MITLYTYRAKLLRVVDGDTVELEVDLGFYASFRHLFRLAGIDTPEYGAGADATAFLQKLLLTETAWVSPGAYHTITTTKADKYGRWLVTIPLLLGETANSRMVTTGYAVPYEGGKK